MKPDIFAEPVWGSLFGLPLTETMATSTLLSVVLIVLGALIARAVVSAPQGRLAAAGRIGFRALESLVEQAAGERE